MEVNQLTDQPQQNAPNRWLVIALILVSLSPIWATTHFPSQNGPWYLLAAHMMAEYDNPQWNFDEFYQLNWRPIPHMLHTVVLYACCHLTSPLVAQKLALSVYVVLLPLSIFYFLKVVAPDRQMLGFLSFLIVHNTVFYRGYHNFCLSLPLFFITFGYWIRHRDRMGKTPFVMLSMLASLVFLAHLFTFQILVFSIGCYRLIETGRLGAALKSIAVATWPGWMMELDFVRSNMQGNHWSNPAELQYLPLHWTIEYFVTRTFYSLSMPACVLGAAAWLWLVYLLLGRLFRSDAIVQRRWPKLRGEEIGVIVLVLAAAYFVVPSKFLGWHWISARFPLFVLGLALTCTGPLPKWNRGPSFRLAFMTTVGLATIGVNMLLVQKVVRIERDIEEYVSAIEAFQPNSTLLPIALENPKYGTIRPLTRAYEYYHIANGGANGRGAAKFNTIVPIVYRQYPVERLFPGFPAMNAELWTATKADQLAKTYDYVLLWGANQQLAAFLENLQFQVVHQQGRLTLYENRRTDVNGSHSSLHGGNEL